MAVDGVQPTLPREPESGLQALEMAENPDTYRGQFPLPDLAATDRLGGAIADGMIAGDAVALWGDLGAGKTTLARAILKTLGVAEDVPSPTFTIVQSYDTPRLAVSHYDLYRVKNAREMEELGFDDALDQGAALVEWPERAPEALPPDTLHVRLSLVDGARLARVTGPVRWQKVLHV